MRRMGVTTLDSLTLETAGGGGGQIDEAWRMRGFDDGWPVVAHIGGHVGDMCCRMNR